MSQRRREGERSRIRPSLLNTRLLVFIGTFAFLSAIIFFCLAVSTFRASRVRLGSRTTKLVAPPSYFNPDDVINSVEYQIALNPRELWLNRTAMVDSWVSSINRYSSFLDIDKKHAIEEYYYQFHYRTQYACDTPEGTKLRFREFLGDPTKRTLDIKMDEERKEQCNKPYWAAKSYYKQSKQKCEQDAHPCFNKFTRSTAVTFNNSKVFRICSELAIIFPDAFELTKKNRNLLFHKKEEGVWWKYQWKGVVGEHMNYKITFNIRYQNSTAARSGTDPVVMGEWSLRFFTLDHTVLWDLDVFDDFQSMFYQLVTEYDVYEDHKKCSKEFLLDNRFHGAILPEDQLNR